MEKDWDMIYPAKDWEEAIQRIVDSEWFLSLEAKKIGSIMQWTARIHDEDEYSRSLQRFISRAGEIRKAIMKVYKEWRDEQLKEDDEE